MKRQNLRRAAIAAILPLAAAAVAFTATTAAAADDIYDDHSAAVVRAAEPSIVDPAADDTAPAEVTVLPLVSTDTFAYTDKVFFAVKDDPRFNAVEITEDRTQVKVWWHGEPTEELAALLSEAPDDVAGASIAPAVFLPGDLLAAGQKLIADGAGIGVQAVAIPPDASGLEVAVERSALRGADPKAALEEIAGFPVTVTPGGVDPAATRLNDDNYHLGGARIHSFPFGPSCSSGFAVQKSGEGDGVMFAAHCGGVGQFWVTTGDWLTAWNYGTTDSRHTAYDGAIMKSNFSQGYVWHGPYDASSPGRVGGVIVPTIGTELCYSGSYSGTVCGNVVTARPVTLNLGGDLTSVTAVQTDHTGGGPAAGNGDSGGPGYALATAGDGQTTRYAATIISAIPGNSGATCVGEPGSTADGGRKCNARVYSTEVWRIQEASGWGIKTAP